jgi:hypothetical protein
VSVSSRPDYLEPALYAELAALYEAAGDWQERRSSNVYGPGFQSFGGGLLPADGEEYRMAFDYSDALAEHPLVREVAARMGGTEHRCYRYRAGHGLRFHTDDYFGGRGHRILFLTREWRLDWGGLLYVIEGEEILTLVCPRPNLLIEIDFSEGRVPHFVSPVAEWAGQPRYVLSTFGGGS